MKVRHKEVTWFLNIKLSEVDYLMLMTCVYVIRFPNIFLFTTTTNIYTVYSRFDCILVGGLLMFHKLHSYFLTSSFIMK